MDMNVVKSSSVICFGLFLFHVMFSSFVLIRIRKMIRKEVARQTVILVR